MSRSGLRSSTRCESVRCSSRIGSRAQLGRSRSRDGDRKTITEALIMICQELHVPHPPDVDLMSALKEAQQSLGLQPDGNGLQEESALHTETRRHCARRASVTYVACLPLLNGYCISQRNPSARVRRLTLGNRTWAAGAFWGGGPPSGGSLLQRMYLLGRLSVWIPVVVVCRLACDCEVPRAPCAGLWGLRDGAGWGTRGMNPKYAQQTTLSPTSSKDEDTIVGALPPGL